MIRPTGQAQNVAPLLDASMASLADQPITTLTQLPNFVAGPNGILVTADSRNTGTVRISGSDASTTQGQRLIAGASVVFSVTNASVLYAVSEDGTSQTLQVSSQ